MPLAFSSEADTVRVKETCQNNRLKSGCDPARTGFGRLPPSRQLSAIIRTGRDKVGSACRSAAGVPAVRKRNKVPDQLIVVGGSPRSIRGARMERRVFARGRRNGRPYGIQQSLEFSFTHRALPRSRAQGVKTPFVSN